VARACDLGVAMQLTNIARDVGEDARAGRLYLPRVWLLEVGIDPEAFLLAPTFSPELANVVARLLRYADDLYRRADRGIANLDPACRPAIFAARHLYSEIGAEVGRRGLDSVSGRASVPTWRKLALLARAVRQAARSTTVEAAGLPLEETRYLVEAVVKDRHGSAPYVRRAKRGVEEDVAWLVNLFADLDGRLGAEVPPR
jgi:phytoene synthase